MIKVGSDVFWMRRALRVASRGFTPPNPMVGCVLVKDGELVAEGFHPLAGQPHAEVFALRSAGERARGATAYVTLEPCCHYGRTPPCTEALVSAGVTRVVAAIEDADPRVAGKGVAMLRAAGVAVEVGLLSAEARQLNASFFYYHAHSRPYVTLKTAITLDGKTATRCGNSRWITGNKARAYVHKLRAQSSAVMVGIGTLLADDPELTARLLPDAPRQPTRIIVDSALRTPANCRAIAIANSEQPLIIVTTEDADIAAERELVRPGVEVVRTPSIQGADGPRVDLGFMLRLLAERHLISILVEAGGVLNAALLDLNLVNRALYFVAPKIFGGRDAPTSVEGIGATAVSDAKELSRLRVRRFGNDIALEGELIVMPDCAQRV